MVLQAQDGLRYTFTYSPAFGYEALNCLDPCPLGHPQTYGQGLAGLAPAPAARAPG